MPNTARLLSTLVVLVLVARAAPALAQDIQKLNEQGIEAFQAGRFAEAAQKFHDAYAIEPRATLKKNEFVAWYKGGECDKAVEAAKVYTGLDKAQPEAVHEGFSVIAKCTVTKARATLKKGDLAAAGRLVDGIDTTKLEPDVAADVKSVRDEVAKRVEAKRKEKEQAAARAQAEQQAKQRQTVGYAVGGAGAALLVVGIIYHIYALASIYPRYKKAGQAGKDFAAYDKLGRQLATSRWLVPVFYGLGLVGTGAGVYLLMWPAEQATPGQTAGLEPARGFAVRWRF